MPSATVNPLLEREAELEQLRTSIETAAAGSGAMVAIMGPAGIGKTRLLRAALDVAARQAMSVLAARGIERERDLPFGVVRQLFEPALRRLDPQARDALLSGAARLAAPVVSLHGVSEHQPRPQASLLHGLYWLTSNLSYEAPLVLGIDDIHWSDPASLSFATHLAQRLEGLPLLLAVTVRSTDPEARLEEVEVLVDEAASVLRPRALSAAAVAALVREWLDDGAEDEFSHACHAATGGNPFFVRELLLELKREGVAATRTNASRVSEMAPAPVTRAVLSRIRHVPGGTSLAEALAVLGDPAELRYAAALAELERDAAARIADELARSGILELARPLSFQHPITRGAVYGALAPARRADLHARAARMLAAEGAPPERCALHLLNTDGSDDPDVVAVLEAAARRSLSRGAADAASTYLRRALAEPPPVATRARLLHELGEAELRAGDLDCVDHLELALEQHNNPGARGPIAHELARALLMSGRGGDAIELLNRESGPAKANDREVGLRLEAELVSVTWVERGGSDVQRQRMEAARSLSGATPGERVLLAAIVPPLAATGDIPASEIADLCERSLGSGRLLAEQGSESPQFGMVAAELATTDELDRAARHLDDGIEDARRRGSALGFFFSSGMRATVAYRSGQILDALSFATQAADVARPHGWLASFPTFYAFLADSLIERGELDAADEVLAESGAAQSLPTRLALMFNQILYRRALVRLARGDPQAAAEALIELDERKRRIGDLNPGRYPWLTTLALALSASGDEARAQRYASEALERARRWGAASSVGIALRTEALLQSPSDRIDRLREAVAVLKASPARLEHARALVDLGVSIRSAGALGPARETLREALDLADRCNATRVAERARRELVGAGGRPRRPRVTGAHALTPSERRIAEMAASGLSNPEIAQALFVTRKTVETHLSSVYRKLAIHSREQLPTSLQEQLEGGS